MNRSRAVWMAITVGLAVSASPAAAQQGTIGADLNRPANAQITCTNNPSPAFLGVLAVPPPFNQSCTWMNNGTITTQTEAFLLPTLGGTVTNVRVRVGAQTAPMQVAVLQAYRGIVGGTSHGACCTGLRMSQVFTPAPNGVTQVAVNLPFGNANVIDENTRNQTNVFFLLGLSVLAPNVPLPLHDTGVHSVDNLDGHITLACYPAVTQPDQQCVTMTNGIASNGFVTLMQADYVLTGANPPPTLPGPAQPPAVAQQQVGAVQPPRFVLARRIVPVRGGVAVVSLDCGAGLPCTGRVQLVPLAGRGAAVRDLVPAVSAQRRRARVYGSAPVNVAPGAKKSIRVRLNAAGRRALRGKRRLRLRLQYVNGAATKNLGVVTLRR